MADVLKTSSKQCDICRGGSYKDTELYLGPWLQKGNITVHYYCLLLSTNLPQEGEDCAGINGFLLRHIRAEIAAAEKRHCEYCEKVGASIQCNKCKIYFHISCGIRNRCLSEFVGEFHSYCHSCITLDEFQKRAKKYWSKEGCFICKEPLGYIYIPTEFLYAPCCQRGFVHRHCMQQYALTAGYYMRCIWCRNVSLRESIRRQGIFVPDREANWETKARFMDLHRGHSRCDVEHCNCKKGREYKSSAWNLINCSLCGSFGAHYPHCIPRLENGKLPSIEEYRCDTCASTERTIHENTLKSQSMLDNAGEYLGLYVCKSSHRTNEVQEVTSTSEEERHCSEPQRDTVLPQCTENTENTVTSMTSSSVDTGDNKHTSYTSTESFLSPPNVEPSLTNAFVDLTETEDDFEELEIFDFSEEHKLIGTCTLRINRNSPRFARKSLSDIMNRPEIFSQSDVIERTGDIIPFERVKYVLMGQIGTDFLASNCPNS